MADALPERTAALKAVLEAMPAATTDTVSAPNGRAPTAVMFKVMGKMFAILSVKNIENVILKSDPHLAEILREQYAGIGHRSHLDPRFWISVSLDADVPAGEVERLVEASYALVVAGLTRKQQGELAALSAG